MDAPGPIVLELPDPSLVLLVGAAGAGKSTFAARHFAPGEVLSSDAFRARIAGDPADQRATGAAFAALHRELSRRLAAGRLTVVDATNVQGHARAALLGRARVAGVPAVALVLDLPPDLVRARNAGRAGAAAVPDEAVHAQLAALARWRAGDPAARDLGFHAVHVLDAPALVERVVIRRSPTQR